MSSAPSRSSCPPDPLRGAAEAVLAEAAADAVILIDGRSGAGKSTLARAVAAGWPHRGGAQLVALDDLYPGWDGLEAGSAYAFARVLAPHAAGVIGRWQEWDWAADRYAAVRETDPRRALIIEGSGVLTPQARAVADIAVWLDAPDDVRRVRALERDGDTYLPHWQRWSDQEERHLVAHDPRSLATHVFAIG